MKHLTIIFILLVAAPYARAGDPMPVQAEVYFSPNGGCTEAIVREIGAAKKTIYVMAYSFTSAPIAGALREAHKRGVVVFVMLDKTRSTERYSVAASLAAAGIPIVIARTHQHNKSLIIDGTTTITGSFNFTAVAEERNAENILVLRSTALAARYLAEWEKHRARAEK
jgi:phosphatidylserine/phosphatidylglycerophosphate/cardiolipin synthase-like enzyme